MKNNNFMQHGNILNGYDQYSQYKNNKWPNEYLVEYYTPTNNNNSNNIMTAPRAHERTTAYENAKSVTSDIMGKKEITCPPDIQNICGPSHPYMCLYGFDRDHCAATASALESNPRCNNYCNVLKAGEYKTPASPTSIQPIPPPRPIPLIHASQNGPAAPTSSKFVQCPTNFNTVCGQNNPFQCLAGDAVNGCSSSASFWENTPACTSYCNIYSGTNNNVPPKTQRTIKVTNNCPKKIWVATYGQNYIPANGGFELGPHTSNNITVPSNWTAGRIWGRTGCVPGPNGALVCETGDCNGKLNCTVTGQPPASLAEFTLSNNPNTPDYYDLSLVDGYNLPISITPIQGSYQNVNNPNLGKFNCGSPGCKSFDMSVCPSELTIKGTDGTYCASICTAVNNPSKVEHPSYLENINKALVCCSCDCGPNCGCDNPNCKYGCSPYSTDPNAVGGKCNVNTWPKSSTNKQYNQIFKNQCPDAYSWQFDDQSSTYQCVNADYEVTFC
ncbi:hypothetical protein QJ857_gp1097 [Tupanvirus soda lake]|uniref:Thaumatin domain-containing protein n=2 Tax=Tupanvirus TaxID=2094720 RepID=A0A6N1NQK4_9VIRU|nr:hypothetical protein QJ857_gp1097 [Tupanvirus soda lake]QKU34957.1 hypothetical protein [Tupanvirus soda lake]